MGISILYNPLVTLCSSELAKYHALAPFESQASKSAATYLLSGEALAPTRSFDDEDVEMDDEDEEVSEDGDNDGDGDEVSRTRVMLVNERDLEGSCKRVVTSLANTANSFQNSFLTLGFDSCV